MSSPSTLRAMTTDYRLVEHGAGLVTWLYEYWNPQKLEKSSIGAGLEIAVQLAGEWRHRGDLTGQRLYASGTIQRIHPGERYDLSFAQPHGRGVQVGFILHLDQLQTMGLAADSELVLAGDAGLEDARLVEMATWFREEGQEDPRSSATLHDELSAYVRRHAEARPADAVFLGKRELEAYADCDLPIQLIADAAGMHPVTFSRQFKRRFGLSPATYRVVWRLHHASRLLWSRPAMSVDDVAVACGFQQRTYFFRAFKRFMGCTPAEHRAARTRHEGLASSLRA